MTLAPEPFAREGLHDMEAEADLFSRAGRSRWGLTFLLWFPFPLVVMATMMPGCGR